MSLLSIAQPWLLCLLVVCPVLAVAAWRNRSAPLTTQGKVALATRLLAMALLVFAVAGTHVRWPTHKLAVAFVPDTSRSVSPAEMARVRAQVSNERIDHEHIQWADVTSVTPSAATETNLERSIETAAAVLPREATRRILLATDGRATRGDVLAAADRARREGIEVSVLPVGDHPTVDTVAVTGIDLPRIVRAGRNASVTVRLYASRATTVRVELLRDHVAVATRRVDVPAGASANDLAVTFPDEGVHTLTAHVSSDGDSLADNNTWDALVRVVSPPRVLLVHDLPAGAPALAQVYRDAHLRVDEVHPDQVPTDARGFEPYQFVTLDEITLTSLSAAQQMGLRTWVEERGGGLLTTTGMHGVGTAPETLRAIEPIQPPRSVPEPRPIELVLVVDRSGSMQGQRMVSVREAAIAAVRALRPDSRVGMVAFSGTPDVVVSTVAMSQSDNVTRTAAGLTARGGTDLAAALRAARPLVSSDPRYLHHVIVLSDGDSQSEPARQAAQDLRSTGATITAITLGPRSGLMADIARIGHGNYVATSNLSSLAELFVHEAAFRNPPPARDIAFRPGVNARMSFMEGVDPANDDPILGFVTAQARPGALVLLTAPDGGPLLSHWSVGLGQVATLATSTTSRWANAWRENADFRRLFGQMAWEMMRANAENDLAIHVDPLRGHEDIERVSIVAPTLAPTATPIVMASRGRREGVRLEMRSTAPGVWTADIARENGFIVDARLPSSLEPTVAAAVDHPYPDELAAFGSDAPALEAIARAGGGRVLSNVNDVMANIPIRTIARDGRLALFATALFLYIAGLYLLRMPWPSRRGAERSVRRDNAGPATQLREAA